ncbi:adhesion G-protein coupled receptor G6-like [Glandiceps talaboti]
MEIRGIYCRGSKAGLGVDARSLCHTEITSNDKGIIQWPSVKVGYTVERPCPYGAQYYGIFVVQRSCLQVSGIRRPVWGEYNTSECIPESQAGLGQRLRHLAGTYIPAGFISKILDQFSNVTFHADLFQDGDFSAAVAVLQNILDSNKNGTIIDEDVAVRIMQSVGHLSGVDRVMLRKCKKDKESTVNLIRAVERLSEIMELRNKSFTIDVYNVVMTVVEINATSFEGLTFSVSSDDTKLSKERTLGLKSGETAIELPSSLFDNLDESLIERVQFFNYKSDIFFNAADDVTKGELSSVIAASIGGDFAINNLTDPVKIAFDYPAKDKCKIIEFHSNGMSYAHQECVASSNCPSETSTGLGPCHGSEGDKCAVHCCEGDLCNVFLPLNLTPRDITTPDASTTTTHLTTTAEHRKTTTVRRITTVTTAKDTTTASTRLTTTSSTSSAVYDTSTLQIPKPNCPTETTADDKGLINWPVTEASVTVYRKCPYQSQGDEDQTVVERTCLLRTQTMAEWTVPDTSGCKSEAQSSPVDRLNNLVNTTILPEHINIASDRLNKVTTEAESFDEIDVGLSVDVVDNIIETIDSDNADKEVVENLLQSVGNLFKVDRDVLEKSNEDQNIASRLVEAIEQLSRTLKVENESVSIETDEISMTVAPVNSSVFDGFVFTSSYDRHVQRRNIAKKEDYGEESVKSTITLPSSVLDGLDAADKSGVSRAQFIAYKSNTLFEIMKGETSRKHRQRNQTMFEKLATDDNSTKIINSPVISASVGDLEISDLKDPIEIAFTRSKQVYRNLTCVFWNFSINDGHGGWSDKGCVLATNVTESDNITVCQCNHLTNFALLLDIYDGGSKIDSSHQKALSIISYIGCAISLLALIVTLINLILFGRKRDKPTRIMINLCLALVMTLSMFLIGAFYMEFTTTIPELCTTISVLLHYFLLAVLTWMALEAVQMYLMLIKVFKTYIAHFMVKFCLLGWGIPIIIVVITIGVDLDNYGYHNNICWLSRYALYGAFLAPLCLVIIFNSIIYCLVIKQLCGLRSKTLTANERFSTTAQLRAAIGLLVLLGLTWILAIFAVGDASLIFQYLFAVSNSLQGFFIFIFHCVLNKEIQKRWRRLCRCNWASYKTVDSSLMTGTSLSSDKYQPSTTDHTTLQLDVTSASAGSENHCYDNGDLCSAEMKTFKEGDN